MLRAAVAKTSVQRLVPVVPAACFHVGSSVRLGKSVPFLLSDIGEGIAEVEVLQWFVAEGDAIKEFDKVCEVQSDKATVEITSRFAGTVGKLHYQVGDMASVGTALIDVITDGAGDAAPAESSKPAAAAAPAAPAAPAPAAAASAPAPSGAAAVAPRRKSLATPAVRRLAAQHKIDINTVAGTGRGGLVTKGDMLAFIERGGAASAPAAPSAAAPQQGSAPVPQRATRVAEDTVEQIRGFKRIMVQTMNAAHRVPTFLYCDDIDMTALVEMRGEIKSFVEKQYDVKFTYMPFIIKASSIALSHYPILNSVVSEDESTITYKAAHNVGVAMDTPMGLVVPNIKNVQDLSVVEIARELNRLIGLGKAGKLSTDDLTGGTFTLSNIGAIGGTVAKPLVVLPEVAIGALGRIQKLPRFDEDGDVVAAHIMQVSWSADHRIIDGATMANFGNVWKAMLEDPRKMMLELR